MARRKWTLQQKRQYVEEQRTKAPVLGWPGEPPVKRTLAEKYDRVMQGLDNPAWAPFEQESGAWVPYVIEPMAESILRWVLKVAGQPESPLAFLKEPQFQPMLDRWARAEARRMRYEGYVMERGELDELGNPNKLMDQLVAWEKRSAYHAERCGLDPLALAKIQRELQELHRERDAGDALASLQAKYARRRPQVLDGGAGSGVEQ